MRRGGARGNTKGRKKVKYEKRNVRGKGKDQREMERREMEKIKDMEEAEETENKKESIEGGERAEREKTGTKKVGV